MYLNAIEHNNALKSNFNTSEITSIQDLSLGYRAESEMFRYILKNHHDPVLLLRIEDCGSPFGVFVDVNHYLSDHLGYTRDELFRLSPRNIFAAESIPLAEKSILENLKINTMIWEGVLQSKNQKKIPVEIKGYAFEKDGFHLLIFFLRDISCFKKSMEELHNHQSLLERAESIGQMGYWEFDVKNDKFWASHGAREIYGMGEREFSFGEIRNIPFPEYRLGLDQTIEKLITNGEKYDVEFKIHRLTDGTIIHIRSMAEYDMLEKKIYGIIQDISKQKKVEQELIYAKERAEESDRLKSAFLSNMSHEIRTPMNGIVGFAHLLVDMDIDTDTRNEYNNMIYQCCNQLLGTVNEILDLAKIESGQIVLNKVWININTFLQDIHKQFLPQACKKKLDLRLVIDLEKEDQMLFSDLEKLRQVITNLLDNALAFTASGYVEYGVQIHAEYLLFYVKDSGMGISAADHQLIFKPFSRAENQLFHENGGTGLGLSIAESYVSMLGGQIWLESELEKGATFNFSIPCVKRVDRQSIIIKMRQKDTKTCLVVEDLEMNYIFLRALLKPLNFNVLWAKDGNEGVEMAITNKDIDLVLMDIRLPGTNGYQATRMIKEKRSDLLIIAQSANALLDERITALQAGCDDYITKPIDVSMFRKMIGSYFDC